jgi:hypothetical protein
MTPVNPAVRQWLTPADLRTGRWTGRTMLRMADVCCCAGGATYGYQQSGFHVTGVDTVTHQDYCGDAFVRCDAVTFINGSLADFDFYHVSPPCQAHSALTKGTNRVENHIVGRYYSDIIGPVRDALKKTGKPWVIENVPGAPIAHHLVLCGEMFGLGVLQHRFFEFGGARPEQPLHLAHRGPVRGWRHGVWTDGPYVAAYGDGGGKGTIEEIQKAKRIWWTEDRRALCEAIPPAYTQYIGRFMYRHLTGYDWATTPIGVVAG